MKALFGLILMAALALQGVEWNDAQIIVPADPALPVMYAAQALQTELRELSGFEPVIVRENEAPAAFGWHVGPTAKSLAVIAPEELRSLAADGVRLRSRDGEVFLRGGNARGEIYSVYVLMEQLYGVRYLTGDCTVRPPFAAAVLPEVDYAFVPSFFGREVLYAGAYGRDISLKQRLNGRMHQLDDSVGGRVDFPEVHTMFRFVPPDEFFAAHPEYFSLRGGKRITDAWEGAQLCLTNPEVSRVATERVLAYLREHPEVDIVEVSQMDAGTGGNGCECEACLAMNEREGSPSGALVYFVNAIAREVAKEFPGKMVSTLAYQHTQRAPKHAVPEANVIIRLCHTGCFVHGFACPETGITEPMTCEFATSRELPAWAALTPNIHVWHYAVNFFHYFAPNPYLVTLVRDLQSYASSHLLGVLVLGDWHSPDGELAELRQYLIARTLWDATLDPEVLIAEFCDGYYGAAAPAVREYLKLLLELSDDPNRHSFAYWDPSQMTSPEFYRRAVAALERVNALAVTPEERERVELLWLPYWYLQLTWPNHYPATEAPAGLLTKLRQLAQQRGITHYAEGGSARTMDAWFSRVEEGLKQRGEL